jgi:DNA-binding LacI/PurR family transcriptional regulator
VDDAGPFDVLPLTVAAVAPPSLEMGRRAMGMLHERLSKPSAAAEPGGPCPGPEIVVLPVTVQTRQAAIGHLRAGRIH